MDWQARQNRRRARTLDWVVERLHAPNRPRLQAEPTSAPTADLLADLLAAWSAAGQRVLEVGPADALHPETFMARGASAYAGLATRPAGLDRLAARFPQCAFHAGDLLHFLANRSARFDLIFDGRPGHGLLERELAGTAAALAPGGWWWRQAPADAADWRPLDLQLRRLGLALHGRRILADGARLLVCQRPDRRLRRSA